MINPSYNAEANFSPSQVDIQELNRFINEKRKKKLKELSKYDIDKESHAKALKMQHLAQTSKYLPLFTKKIQDPRAIKSKIAREIDYSASKKESKAERRKESEEDDN